MTAVQPGGHQRGTPAPRPAAGTAAIVHPYSTGRHLAGILRGRNWHAVAVLPGEPLAVHDHASFQPGDYAAVVTDHEDPAGTAAGLAALGVSAVIAGTESGVPLADALAAKLGAPGNDPATSQARRHKGEMAEALARAGLARPRTIRAATLLQAQAAAMAIGGTVVVKPADSAGSEDVVICQGIQDVAAAWQGAAGRVNLMGLRNDELLIQEYLRGRQFVVNTVSVQAGPGGRPWHYVAEVWLDRRRPAGGGRLVYDRADLLTSQDPRAVQMTGYIQRVLTALGITAGPAHCEAMLTSRGPVLIEAAARLAGMVEPEATRLALGASQADLAAEAATDPAGFASRHKNPYTRLARATQVALIAPRPGILSPQVLTAIVTLPTACGWSGHAEPGGKVLQTVDLVTSPGRVHLAGPAAQVAADVIRIRQLERELYR
ncbi:MAG TPA: ATP-grasp domain-containing protein [Streptosporangiaceae bacterium]|jgi:biotin carboxylase